MFEYDGQAGSQMVVEFGDASQSFAIDNLVYQVPEPAGMAACILLIACWFRRPLAHREERSADDSPI